jgi:pectate lyase
MRQYDGLRLTMAILYQPISTGPLPVIILIYVTMRIFIFKRSVLITRFALLACLLLHIGACKKSNPIREPGQPNIIPDPVTPAPAAKFGLAGFATQNGGTTGGEGGTVVTATTYAELKTYLESSTKYIVNVNSRIYNGVKGGSIKINANKTLMGIGTAAFLDGVGLTIAGKNNVIIRNIKITLTSITDTSDPAVYDPDGDEGRAQIIVNGGDCISVSGTSSNIWIDHCELYEIDPAVQTNQDLYDGLIDIKNASQYITISWCYFHDNHKTHLIGSSDDDNFDRKLTFHHNYYNNIKSRLPLNRFGKTHVYNNYFYKIGSSGIDARMGACVKVENNVFENVKSPVISSGTILGTYEVTGNLFNGITGIAAPTTSTCSFVPSYTYTPDAASTIKAIVMADAGIGKI